jgi:hypothetical protein
MSRSINVNAAHRNRATALPSASGLTAKSLPPGRSGSPPRCASRRCHAEHLPFPGAVAPPEALRQVKAPPGRPTLPMAVAGLPARATGMLEVRAGSDFPLRLPDSTGISRPLLRPWGQAVVPGSARTKQRRSSVEGFSTLLRRRNCLVGKGLRQPEGTVSNVEGGRVQGGQGNERAVAAPRKSSSVRRSTLWPFHPLTVIASVPYNNEQRRKKFRHCFDAVSTLSELKERGPGSSSPRPRSFPPA